MDHLTERNIDLEEERAAFGFEPMVGVSLVACRLPTLRTQYHQRNAIARAAPSSSSGLRQENYFYFQPFHSAECDPIDVALSWSSNFSLIG